MKRELMKFLRENWVRHSVCPSTGSLEISSANVRFDEETEYVVFVIPVSSTLQIKLNVNYGAALSVFDRFATLYSALPGRYNLMPIVVYPKPKIGAKNARKTAEKPTVKAVAA